MLKPNPFRVLTACLLGFALLLIAAWLSGSTAEVCNESTSGAERCIPYKLAPFILIQIREFLHSIENVITAFATVAVAWFTWTLWQSSEKMWIATKQSADAANLSARAAVAIELPIIRIEPHVLSNGTSREVSGGPLVEHCGVHFVTFSNLGRTKAFPVELSYGIAVGVLPAEPRYRCTEPFLINLIFEPDIKVTPRKFLSDQHPINMGEWSLICSGNLPVWFYCEFEYLDFMQVRHEAAFCWKWQNVGNGMGWRPDNTPAYNRKT